MYTAKNKLGFIGRKTTTYKNIVINNESVVQIDTIKFGRGLFMRVAREQTFFLDQCQARGPHQNERQFTMIDT